MTDPSEARSGADGRWQWVLLAALLFYTVLLFYGVGPAAEGRWYDPRGFFFALPGLERLLESPVRALLVFTLVSLAGVIAVFRGGASAAARTAALCCLAAAPLFVFYGTVARFVWEFFGWRGSATLWLVALCVGLSLGAPLLARSWLRLGWPLRIAVYLPFFLVAFAFITNATGTDERLRFAISPWPAVPVFGLEVGALFVCVSLVGVALGLAGLVLHRRGIRSGLALTLVAGLGVPVLLLRLGAWLEMLPFRVGPPTLGAVALACALGIAALAPRAGRDGAALRRRARCVAVGAALIGLPLLSGQAMARYDYHVTREQRARALIDALEAYLEAEELYPDDLHALVEGGYLEEIPEPSIGFGPVSDGDFRYQSFGTSFILEFAAPRWVECAYTPPYEDDYADEEAGEGDDEWAEFAAPEPGGDGDSLGEAWSCPSKPPELW